MSREENKNIKFWLSAIGAPIITAIIILIIYMVKGIYPFGTRNISYFDMAQSMTPIYYHTYDVLHGTKNIFWDWYSAGGQSMIDTTGNFILSPFNFFFYFVKRDMLLEAMSFFLLLKVCVSAGTMSFYIRKTYDKIGSIWHVLMGILYASCGFVVQYYTNIHFLDIMALFPLIMYFSDKLLKERKNVGYIVLMTIGLITNVYLMIMVCIYLILYFAFEIKKGDICYKKDRSALVGYSTLIAVCLSAVISVPTIISLMGSSRVEIGQDLISYILPDIIFDHSYENKMLMLYGCELPIAMIVSYFVFNRKEIKKISKWLCLYIMLAIPIFCELTNMLWHTGSYVEFPMRFGYILTFTGLSFMGSILQRGMDESQISEGEKAEKMKMRWLQYLRIPAIAAIPFIALALFYFMRQFTQSGIRDTSFYSSYWSIFAILIVTYAMALISKDKKVIVTVCSILVILQLGLGWYGFLAPENMFSIECTDSIVKNTESINDIFEEAADHRINRVKDNSVSLNANYPFILKQASISNWTLGAKPAFRRFMGKLGYSTDYTRILDNGGTLFSDAFLHVTNCISKEQLSSQLYSSIIEKNGYIYGETKYTYPFGLLVPETIKNLNGNEATSAFDLQNILFKLINQNEEDLIEIYDASSFLLSEGITENDTYQYVLQIPIEDKSVLYIENIQNEDPNFYTFYINGKNKTISALDYEENYVYPACFNNGIIDCGIYQNETVDFVIESLNPIIEGEITFGCLSLEKIQNSIAEQEAVERVVKANKNSLYMEVQNDHADYILIPIGYDSSTMVKVNGRKIISQTVADDAFYLIPLEKGKNVITMYFLPAGLKLGILISVIGILAFIGSWFWKEKIVSCKLVQSVMYILLNIMEKGIILLLYIIPILITIGVKIWFHFYLPKQ